MTPRAAWYMIAGMFLHLYGAIGYLFNRPMPAWLKPIATVSYFVAGMAGAYTTLAIFFVAAGVALDHSVLLTIGCIMMAAVAFFAKAFVKLCEKVAPIIMNVFGWVLNPAGLHLTQIDLGVQEFLADMGMGFLMISSFALLGKDVGLQFQTVSWVGVGILVAIIIASGAKINWRRRLMVMFTAIYVVLHLFLVKVPGLRRISAAAVNWVGDTLNAGADLFIANLGITDPTTKGIVGIVLGLLCFAFAGWIIGKITNSIPASGTPTTGTTGTGATNAPAAPAQPAGGHGHGGGHGGEFNWPAFAIAALAIIVICFLVWLTRPTVQFIPASPVVVTTTPAPTPVVYAPTPTSRTIKFRLDPKQLEQVIATVKGGDKLVWEADKSSVVCQVSKETTRCAPPTGLKVGPSDFTADEWANPDLHLREYPVRKANFLGLVGYIGNDQLTIGSHYEYLVPNNAGENVEVRMGHNLDQRLAPFATDGHTGTLTVTSYK